MANRPDLLAILERRYLRRLLTLPCTCILAVVALVLAPLTLAIAALIDRGRPWQRVRLVALVTGGLAIELVGIIGALLAWIISGFGLIRPRQWSWPVHRRLMGAYTSSLLWWIARVLGTRIEWRGQAEPITGPVVLLARHTSFFDALIPATLLSRRNGLIGHHVLTAGLRYLPCLDLVGHRFPNRFIARTPSEGSRELTEIEQLAGMVDERSGVIIFPEGTFRDPDRFERAVDRLRRRGDVQAARAAELRHVLPPRPQGTRALLQGASDAKIVVCANTGLEPFSTLAEIRSSLVAKRPIIIETWTVSRDDLPDDLNDTDAFALWLLGVYEGIDTWVDATMPPA